MKILFFRFPLFLCVCSAFSTLAFADPSPELVALFKNNVFVQYGTDTAPKVRKLYRSFALKLHPDHLSADDKAFVDEHRAFLSKIYGESPGSNPYALPMNLLQVQMQTYLSVLEKMSGGKKNYCELCDQVVETEYLRAEQKIKGTVEYTYAHSTCLKSIGLAKAKALYSAGDVDKFAALANMLSGEEREDAWLFFIEKELIKGKYHNVFNNLFTILPKETDGYHNQSKLKAIADILFEQKMDLDTFAGYLKSHGKETSSMDYLTRNFLNKYFAGITTAEQGLAIIAKFSEKFLFAKHYYAPKGGFLRDVIYLTDCGDAAKHLVSPLLASMTSKEHIDDFFLYAGNFDTFAMRFPVEARSLFYTYQSGLCKGTRENAESHLKRGLERGRTAVSSSSSSSAAVP
jgi:hypothetical protein